ncbi:MAG TPA: hypothetical protein VF699_01605 [Caulobacteraceae bacterium]|jgi:hypothetical protein
MTYNEDYDRQEEARKAAERGAKAEPASHPGARSLQDKAAIDAGLSHDKVAGMDLGAAPMGADAEAGGSTAEVAGRAPAVEGGAGRDPNRANAVRPPLPWIWIVVAIAAAVGLAFVLLLGVT